MTDTIQFTENKYEAFREAYNKAIENNLSSFIFEDNEFLTSYAKYLLDYLNFNYE